MRSTECPSSCSWAQLQPPLTPQPPWPQNSHWTHNRHWPHWIYRAHSGDAAGKCFDCPWPRPAMLFSMTFQAWKMVLLNSNEFPWPEDTLYNTMLLKTNLQRLQSCTVTNVSSNNSNWYLTSDCQTRLKVSRAYNQPEPGDKNKNVERYLSRSWEGFLGTG